MSSQFPRVYVGIVTYNSAALITRCLTALFHQRSAEIHIVVLDNNSADSIVRIMKRYGKRLTFIRSRVNLGFGGGHNEILRSVRLCDTDYYVALNPDALPEPDCFANFVRASRNHSAAWVTGKFYKDKHARVLYSVGHALRHDGYAFNIGHGIVDRGQYDTPREVFGAPGAAALYRGSMIRTLSVQGNFFDPDLFMYYEDVDVDWRGRLHGLRCWYEPSAAIVHPGGTFPRSLEAEVLANRFLCILKNAYISDLIFYNIPLMCAHIIFRVVITPAVGLRILRKMIRMSFRVLHKRVSPHISGQEMLAWFAWSANEVSGQPVKQADRMRVFIRRLLRA